MTSDRPDRPVVYEHSADSRPVPRLRRAAWNALSALRWWFGVTYVLAGVGCAIVAPVWMATDNWGGLYLLGGGVVMATAGWLIHPWGYARYRQHKVRVA